MAQAIASYALGGLPALAQYGKGQAVGTVTGNQLANIINHKAMMDTYASKGFGIGMTNPTARAAHAIAANSSGYGDINSISGLGYGIEDDPSDFGGGYSDGTSSASDGGEAGADAASSAGANDGPDTGGSFAQGGIPSIPMGELRKNAQGVQELDYRQDGGFVPVGIKEKADDVPAMLSKNEFVMTADAVRGMGNGNIENGAQKMYNLMKSLENRMA